MTTDSGSEDIAAGTEASTASGVPPVSEGTPTDRDVPHSKSANRSRKKKNVERPTSVSALFQYAYAEATAGRKLNLARDLSDLDVDPVASQEEIDSVRTLAAEDLFLVGPPNLLANIADLQMKRLVRKRVLELVLAALATHKLFEGKVERLSDPHTEPALTAREISNAARSFTFDPLDQEKPVELSAGRERLRVNAVTAFELFRVLRDGWTTEQFIEDMRVLIWDDPSQREPGAVALLAMAKGTDALSQLSRHFEVRLRNSDRETDEARELAAAQSRRVAMTETRITSLTADLEAEQLRAQGLQAQVAELERSLKAEQSNRFVDKSHSVDDYEALRTQVIRRLSGQVALLKDGLHALRNGSNAVAEEFVDRALIKIDGEVSRLKSIEGGSE